MKSSMTILVFFCVGLTGQLSKDYHSTVVSTGSVKNKPIYFVKIMDRHDLWMLGAGAGNLTTIYLRWQMNGTEMWQIWVFCFCLQSAKSLSMLFLTDGRQNLNCICTLYIADFSTDLGKIVTCHLDRVTVLEKAKCSLHYELYSL